MLAKIFFDVFFFAFTIIYPKNSQVFGWNTSSRFGEAPIIDLTNFGWGGIPNTHYFSVDLYNINGPDVELPRYSLRY